MGNLELSGFVMATAASDTLHYGLPEFSCIGVMALALPFSALGNYETAGMLSDIASSLIEEATAIQTEVNCRIMNTFFIDHWRKPLTACLEAAIRIKETVMEGGIVDQLFICTIIYTMVYINSGLRLEPLSVDLENALETLEDFNFQKLLVVVRPDVQMIQNLMGFSKDPTILTGEMMNQNEALEQSVLSKNKRAYNVIQMRRQFLAVIFNDYELAVAMSKELISAIEEGPTAALPSRFAFEGFAYFARAHETGESYFVRKGRSFLVRLEKMMAKKCPNVYHYIALLRAENYAFIHRRLKDTSKIRRAYDDAISASGRLGILHLQALANERAGLFFLQRDDFWAKIYLTQAYEKYEEWGASAKSEDMKARYTDLIEARDSSTWTGTALRSRTRLEVPGVVERSKSFDEILER